MQLILSFVPLLFLIVLVPVIYGVFVKLCARILKFDPVTFKHGYVFGLAMVIFSLLVRLTTSLLGYTLPIVPGVILAFGVHLIFGAWYFSPRGRMPDGHSLGWAGGVKLAGLASVLVGITGVILLAASRLLMR